MRSWSESFRHRADERRRALKPCGFSWGAKLGEAVKQMTIDPKDYWPDER